MNQVPFYEQVITDEGETFLWRCDDYPWVRNVWHVHPEFEVHLLRNADGVALVGDHIGTFGPGYLAVVGGGLPHDWVTAVAPEQIIRERDVVLQFDAQRVRRAAAWIPELAQLDLFLSRALRGLAFTGHTRRTAADLMERIGPAIGVERIALFLQLLHVLAVSQEFVVLSSEGFAPKFDQMTLDTIQRALIYVFENFQHDLRMTDVAAMFGMSESGFSRFFKKNSGNSFVEHVAKLRIGRACKLLSDTTEPITDICFQVGFLNISNFNRIFRAQRGITPSAYRRLSKQRMA